LFLDNSIISNFSDDNISIFSSEFTAFYGHNLFIHQALKTSHLSINCANAVSLKINELPTFEDALRDDYCSRVFLSQVAPDGFVAVLGDHNYSNQSPDYKLIQNFSKKWINTKPQQWPIATGGTIGIMGAAISETKGAGGVLAVNLNQFSPPIKFKNQNTFTYIDYNKREADLLNYAQAIVIGAGSLGTIYEMVTILENVYLGKKTEIPIVVLSSSSTQKEMVKIFSTLMNSELINNAHSRCKLINFSNSSQEAIELIMMDKSAREKHPSSGCQFLSS
jgi:predicted Rossmann-fold nucleotide-binding protein